MTVPKYDWTVFSLRQLNDAIMSLSIFVARWPGDDEVASLLKDANAEHARRQVAMCRA